MEKFAADPANSLFLYDTRYFGDKSNVLKADLSLSLDVLYHRVKDEI